MGPSSRQTTGFAIREWMLGSQGVGSPCLPSNDAFVAGSLTQAVLGGVGGGILGGMASLLALLGAVPALLGSRLPKDPLSPWPSVIPARLLLPQLLRQNLSEEL